MEGNRPQSSGEPVLNIVGERVALGPLREELLPVYGRWINDFGTIRMLGLPPRPVTAKKERDWYEDRSKAENDLMFTVYERETLRPIGNTALHGLDHRNRSASFGIIIGEPGCRGKGYGTETTRLMLDYASPRSGCTTSCSRSSSSTPRASGPTRRPASSPSAGAASAA